MTKSTSAQLPAKQGLGLHLLKVGKWGKIVGENAAENLPTCFAMQ